MPKKPDSKYPDTVVGDLTEARDILSDPMRWTRLVFRRPNGSCCLLGACSDGGIFVRQETLAALGASVRALHEKWWNREMEMCGYVTISRFNDFYASYDQVIEVLNHALERETRIERENNAKLGKN